MENKSSLQEIVDTNYGENVPFPESLEGIYSLMNSLSSEEDTKLVNIGKSKEDRDIFCLKIGNGKKIVLVNARFEHPHEYHGTPALLKLAELLVKEKLWKNLDATFYIFPAASPDGVAKNTWVKRGAGVVEYLKSWIDKTASSASPAFDGFADPSEELKQYIKFYDEIRPHYYFNLHGDGVTEKNCIILHNEESAVQKEIENIKGVWRAKKSMIMEQSKDNTPSPEAIVPVCDGIVKFDKDAFEEINKRIIAERGMPYIPSESFLVEKFGAKSFTLEASFSQELSKDVIKVIPRKAIDKVNKRLINLRKKVSNKDTIKMIDNHLESRLLESYWKMLGKTEDLDKIVELGAKDYTELVYCCNLMNFGFESKLIKELEKDDKQLAERYRAKLYRVAESFPTKVYKKFYQESAEEKTDWIISTMLAALVE